MEPGALVKSIDEYFYEQRLLFGSTLFIEKPESTLDPSESPADAAPITIDMAPEQTPPVSVASPTEIKQDQPITLVAIRPAKVPEPVQDQVPATKEITMSDNTIIKLPDEWKSSQSLDDLKSKICNCHQCVLGSTRKNFVFGTGNPDADLVVIGEAPGADEDEQGAPFVGRAGQLLTKILESVNFSRDEVFICNIIKCRPPENRRPLVPEVDACEPFLKKQIELIKPRFILALGLTAVDTLLKKKHTMANTRGSMMDYHGIQMLVTYHPAALLRNPEWKRAVWEDVKYLRRIYDEYQATKNPVQ